MVRPGHNRQVLTGNVLLMALVRLLSGWHIRGVTPWAAHGDWSEPDGSDFEPFGSPTSRAMVRWDAPVTFAIWRTMAAFPARYRYAQSSAPTGGVQKDFQRRCSPFFKL
jgi:hypothetical protein